MHGQNSLDNYINYCWYCSVLCDLDDEDECNLLNKKDKHCPEIRHVLPQEVHNAQNKSKRYTWKDGSLAMNDLSTSFTGSVVLPEDISALESPLHSFDIFLMTILSCT